MLTEVYKAKTETGRQSIYTALGQLMIHGPANEGEIKRVLAIPPGELAADIQHSLAALGIVVRRFDITGREVPTLHFSNTRKSRLHSSGHAAAHRTHDVWSDELLGATE